MADIFEWVSSASRGDSFTYCVGDVATSRYDYSVAIRNDIAIAPEEEKLIAAAGDAWRLYERREVALVQRRISTSRFAYIAQKL